jgi:hypothetical protein
VRLDRLRVAAQSNKPLDRVRLLAAEAENLHDAGVMVKKLSLLALAEAVEATHGGRPHSRCGRWAASGCGRSRRSSGRLLSCAKAPGHSD